MKKVLVVVLAVVSLFTIASAVQAAEKVYRFTASGAFPPTEASNKYTLIPLMKEIEQATGGRVKITVHTGGALGKAQDHFDMAASGIVDIALSVQAYTAGRFPLSSVVELPFLAPSGECGARILWELYEKFPEVRAEYKDVKVLALLCYGSNQLLMGKKPVKTLADGKGLKIRGTGEVQGEMIRRIGAVPLSMAAPDLYESLDKGVIDGTFFAFGAARGFRFFEVTKHVTVGNFFVGPQFLVMNLKKWHSLPPDIQKTIDSLTGEKASLAGGRGYDAEDRLGLADFQKAKAEIYRLPADELAKWKAAFAPISEKWVSQMETKGLPGRKILEEARRIAEKCK
jgi:TRAP-type C4-dicarboxylate transport system substrate-binding protein